MKKNLLTIPVILLCLTFAACSSSGGGKKSAASLAQEWCDLNGKVHRATDGPEKETAKAALKKWEDDTESKYKSDSAFMRQVGAEVEKCEDASEGRK